MVDDSALSWLGSRPFELNHVAGAWNPTIYSLLALVVYMAGLIAFSWSTRKVWMDRRAAYKQPDVKLRILAHGNWRSTFDRWLTMALLFLLGALGTTASDVSGLPTNLRRAIGLVLIALFIGLFCNAERITWTTRNKLAEYIRTEVRHTRTRSKAKE